MRRFLSIPGSTVALFLIWKVALVIFSTQPVPSNDAFFYDGPVVNYVLHGAYCNPSLAQVLPISGTKVFCAYPPLYQAVLLGWMKCFGASALAAIWLHLGLLTLFGLTVLAIFRELKLSAAVINFAGCFLFGITFHDRPDTLAHFLGALAILAAVRGLPWPAAVFLLLTFSTSFQIGGIYAIWLGSLTVMISRFTNRPFPWAAGLAFFGTFFGLIALVKFGHPLWWEGFREHVKITPSVTGLRMPHADELLKVLRTTPGLALSLASLVWIVLRRGLTRPQIANSPALLVAVSGTLAALALTTACLLVITPNTIHIAGYLQPIVVGCFLGAITTGAARKNLNPLTKLLFAGAVVLVSIRAIGMTTWGLLCARDVGYRQTANIVKSELDSVASGNKIFVSAAYLYQTAERTNITWIHSDWPALDEGPDWELRAIERLQPAKLLLTQFDYYRRYELVIAQFRREHGEVEVRIDNTARVQPPDAIPLTRKIVQHISWAPVIIEFHWPNPTTTIKTNQ